MRIKLTTTFLFILVSKVLFGQTPYYELPVFFGQYFNDPQVNSMDFSDDQLAFFNLGHRRSSNGFGGINTSFACFQGRLNRKKENGFGELGIHFVNDNEGFLIQRNRGYVSYAYNQSITSKYKLAGGISFGFYNFTIKPDDGFEGVADLTYDGGFLVKLYSNKTKVQFTVSQAFNSSIQPILQKTILTRNYNLFTSQRLSLSDYVEAQPSLLYRYSKKTDNPISGSSLIAGTQLLFEQNVSMGVNYELNRGFHFLMAIKKINLERSNLGVEFSYFVPSASNVTSNIQLLELVVKYLIKSKEKE